MRFVRSCQGADNINRTFRNGIQIMIVGSTGGRVQHLRGSESFEFMRVERSFMVNAPRGMAPFMGVVRGLMSRESRDRLTVSR